MVCPLPGGAAKPLARYLIPDPLFVLLGPPRRCGTCCSCDSCVSPSSEASACDPCRGEVSDYVLMEGRGFGFVTYRDPQNAQQFLEVPCCCFCATIIAPVCHLVSPSKQMTASDGLRVCPAATRARHRRQEGGGQGCGAQKLRQQPNPYTEDVRWRHGVGQLLLLPLLSPAFPAP